MSKPILDKAEVAIDFPDKFYHGTFSHSSRYEVNLDEDGVHISLDRQGDETRHVSFHIHHQLFAGILNSIADQIDRKHKLPDHERERLREVTEKLFRKLK